MKKNQRTVAWMASLLLSSSIIASCAPKDEQETTLDGIIGSVTALIAEASTADEPSENSLDGQSGDTDFPYIQKMKALATVGEIDQSTGFALTGYPDGNAAWLVDNDTVRVTYQSESYGTMSSETYPWEMSNGVTFTGSHIHTIDYDRNAFAGFLGNDLAASTMVQGSGFLFNTIYNQFGEVVLPKAQGGKWGNQTKPDGTVVEFADSMKLTEADFFFNSFCGAFFEKANKYGDGIGFADDVWITAEEWNISSMFDGTGVDTNDTMGLASVVVDLANQVAYSVPALGQAGYEKILPINPKHSDYVILVLAGYNHYKNSVPLRIYVGKKGVDHNNQAVDGTASTRDQFLARNGLLYGKIYGLAISDAEVTNLGIDNSDLTSRMMDNYLVDSEAPKTFSARFYPTTYQWGGWENPVAVGATEITKWIDATEQPTGYTFLNGHTKIEHPAVDPDITKQRFVQNMTNTGALLGFELTDFLNEVDGSDLPNFVSVDARRIIGGFDNSLVLKTGNKGIVHEGIGTAAFHWEANAAKMVQPDGLQWVKTSDADVLIVDEDSGNDYGERKFALVLNPDDLTLKEDGVGHFLAMAGGSKNPRSVNGIAAYPGTFSRATSSEFSGSWNVTALVTKKPDGAFYSIEELAGTGEQAINSSVTLAETTMIGVVQHAGESGGAVAERKADQGGQIFMFNFKNIETNPSVQFNEVGRYVSGEALDTGAAEIVAFDKSTDRLFVINASAATVDVLSVSSTGSLTKISSIDSSAITGGVSIGGFNSVDAHNGLVAVAVEAATQTDNGSVAFFNASDLSFISSVPVGALPDAVTFSPDGTKVIVSNEGQPNDDYTIDPVGSISIIDVSSGADNATVTTLGFEDYNAGGSKTLPADVRVFGPGASVAQDLEPEYATVSADSSTAWVTLQENNAVAIVDLTTNTLEIKALDFKDHSLPGNELDASDKDNKINIQNWPVKGMYMPDTISSFVVSGNTYYITANEGDARGYGAFDEEARIKSLDLDPTAFPNATALQADEQLGRLAVTTTLGDTDGDGDYDELYSFGARSFTIWDSTGALVFDSGSELERITASRYPAYFNLSNDDNSAGDFEARSDAKGPEPEAVAVGTVDGKLFAFIGLERIGGIAVYNVDNPQSPTFAGYFNNREFGTELTPTTGGDSGPEGLEFVSATDSPTGKALLIVGNEISGTTTVYEIE